MKNRNLFRVLIVMMALVLLLAGCGGGKPKPEEESFPELESSEKASSELPAEGLPEVEHAEKTDVNVAVLKGPTGMGAVMLMKKNDAGESTNNYKFTVAGAPDAVVAQMVSGELDIAALPTNAIAALYQKTEGKVQIAAVNTLGVLYILENGESIKSVEDLKGKTILAAGKGSTAEYVLNYILTQNNLTDGQDVTVFYASEHTEAATLASIGDYDIVMLPEPFVSSLQKQAPNFRIALDLTAEWEKSAGSALTMGGVAVRKEFAEKNPEAVEAFLEEYAASVEYVNKNVDEAAELIEKFDIMPAAVAKEAIPRANIVCLTGVEMRGALEGFYELLFKMNPSSIGGAMPEGNFYYYLSHGGQK